MLIDVIKNGDVVAIKLFSGEEIIGTLVNQDKDVCKLNKPLSIAVGPDGKPGLAPYFMAVDVLDVNSKSDIEFNMNAVTAITKTAKVFSDAYISQTSDITRV